MNGLIDKVSRASLRTAARLLPPERRSWARAIEAEYGAVPTALERLRFSLGCLSFALTLWAQTRAGSVRLARSAVAAGLWIFSAAGMYVAAGLNHGAGLLLTSACIAYIGLGALALISLRALRRAAMLSLLATIALGAVLSTGSHPAAAFYSALLVEAGGLMIGLAVVATVLSRLAQGGRRNV
ncbi:MAG: hypothetical protein ACFE0P_02185 [Oceanicaulis sp.]